MRRLLASTALLLGLLAAPALGGGFATTGLSSLPDGTAPGEPWVVDVTILAHGVTPVDGMEPAVTISRGTDRRTFPARPRGDGVHRATVVFPGAGRWRYAVESDYGGGSDATTFGAVTIAERETPSATAAGPRWPLALLAGLAAAVLAAAASRSLRRPQRAVTAA